MPVPSQSHITLVGGLNAVNSTIYTNSLIKIGDTIKVSGTASNNSVYAITDVVTTSGTGEGVGTTFTDDTYGSAITSGTTITMDGTNTQIVVGLSVSGTNIAAGSIVKTITATDPLTFVMAPAVEGTVSAGATLTFGDMDIYYCVKGGALTAESSAE